MKIRTQILGFEGLRWGSLFVAILLLTNVGTPMAEAAPSAALQSEVEQISEATITEASTAGLIRAIKVVISKRPKLAPELIELLGKAKRKTGDTEIAQMVAAAIAAAGESATCEMVADIVDKAVGAQPKSAPAIVAAALKAAPKACAYEIIEVAVSALPDPTLMINGVTLSELVARAALQALPGLDPADVFAAANRGFQTSLAALFGRTVGSRPRLNFSSLSKDEEPEPASPR